MVATEERGPATNPEKGLFQETDLLYQYNLMVFCGWHNELGQTGIPSRREAEDRLQDEAPSKVKDGMVPRLSVDGFEAQGLVRTTNSPLYSVPNLVLDTLAKGKGLDPRDIYGPRVSFISLYKIVNIYHTMY